MKRERYLILVRHAHRETSFIEPDNGLSEKGKLQVESLKVYFEKEWAEGLDGFQFLSSPKQRCIETLKPLAATFNNSLRIEPLLDEHEPQETYADFLQRTEAFLKAFLADSNSWVCCSHGDWIPGFIDLIGEIPVQLKTSGVLVLKCSNEGNLNLTKC